MKDLVAAAAMMAEGSPDQSKKSSVDDDHRRKGVAKKLIAEEVPSNCTATTTSASSSDGDKPLKKKDVSVARARRLEQNRRAAAESRRRKKVMIEELQRSVTFYTKANQNLLMDNTELEHRLYLAKRSLGMNVEGQQLKSPPEESNQVAEVTNAAMSTSYEQLINIDLQLHHQQKPGASPTAGAIPFPHLHNSISPIEQLHQGTQASQPNASTALHGYAFSQLTGTSNVANEAGTALNLADHLDTKRPSVMPTFPLPSKEEVGSIKHIKSLEKVCCCFLFTLLSYYITTAPPFDVMCSLMFMLSHPIFSLQYNRLQPPMPPPQLPMQPYKS